MLFELPDKALAASDTPESWIKNVEIVDLWAKEQQYVTHGVSWFKLPDGSMVCSLLNNERLCLTAQDELGRSRLYIGKEPYSDGPMQQMLDEAYSWLCLSRKDQQYIWDIEIITRWGKKPASDKQIKIIQKRCKGFDSRGLTSGQASQILNRLFNGGKISA